MNVGIVGLGLIGGSLARAYKNKGITVLGMDKSEGTQEIAKIASVIDGDLDESHFKNCDLIILAINPSDGMDWLRKNSSKLSEKNIVVDCSGTKREICSVGFKYARKDGFTFIGGHPMAGKQYGGFKNSTKDLFAGATMVLVPENGNDIELLSRIKAMLKPVGFGSFSVTSPEEHDKMIAFTSQMAHVVSNAFIKSDTALSSNQVFSAGSYRDVTRVAYLDENIWTQLFMENRDNLKEELGFFIEELKKYEVALEENNGQKLKELLAQGKQCKLEIDKKLCYNR